MMMKRLLDKLFMAYDNDLQLAHWSKEKGFSVDSLVVNANEKYI